MIARGGVGDICLCDSCHRENECETTKEREGELAGFGYKHVGIWARDSSRDGVMRVSVGVGVGVSRVKNQSHRAKTKLLENKAELAGMDYGRRSTPEGNTWGPGEGGGRWNEGRSDSQKSKES